jgi:O-antigen/teichoic acid export membrane protein
MIKNILNTFFTRSVNAGLAFFIVVITARYLGAEIRGEISLFVLNITLIFQAVSIVGGGLIYYTPRKPVYSLIISTVLWSFIAVPLVILLLYLTGFASVETISFLALAAFLLSWFMSGLNILIGYEKIKTYNLLSLFQMIVLISFLGFFIVQKYFNAFETWYWAYIISIAVGLIGMKIEVLKLLKKKDIIFRIKDIITLFNYGKWTQLANIAQLLNYRMGYYFIEYFEGKQALGIYSSAVIIAEGTWLISKSFAMVVLSRIVNLQDRKEATLISIQYARISLYFSLAFILILVLIPADFYIWLFGQEFHEIKLIVLYLTPGIASFALTTIYAHYFSGTGRPNISSYSSIFGLVVTLGLGLWLIPIYGKLGAAITASASFIVSGFYLTYKMLKEKDVTLRLLLPQKSDYRKVKEFLSTSFNRNI